MSLLQDFANMAPDELHHARVMDTGGLAAWWAERRERLAARKAARPMHIEAGHKAARTRKGRA